MGAELVAEVGHLLHPRAAQIAPLHPPSHLPIANDIGTGNLKGGGSGVDGDGKGASCVAQVQVLVVDAAGEAEDLGAVPAPPAHSLFRWGPLGGGGGEEGDWRRAASLRLRHLWQWAEPWIFEGRVPPPFATCQPSN